ncbi:hypothetical protein AKAW_06258 [Aspergillus luchuensis IFO 4308]|nr:hypothetical protein AKAW_06258 [Aspergillus luchuensis IFO 4308]
MRYHAGGSRHRETLNATRPGEATDFAPHLVWARTASAMDTALKRCPFQLPPCRTMDCVRGDVLEPVVSDYAHGHTSDHVMVPMYLQQDEESELAGGICCVVYKREEHQDGNSLRHGDHQIYSRSSS